eukprot:gene28401-35249_t
MSGNRFSGSLPETLWTVCTKMEYIVAHDNLLTGTISTSIGESIGYLPALTGLVVDGNLLSGALPPRTLPNTTFNCTKLDQFDIHNNHITGLIPATINAIGIQLRLFNVEHNRLSGSLPRMDNMKSLNTLQINNNFISGAIPSSLSTLKNLLFMFFSHNLLSKSVPSALGVMQRLVIFLANDNNLSGSLPSSLSNWISLQQFFVQNNRLSGELTNVFNGELQTVLKYVDVSDNEFRGAIPNAAFQKSGILSFAAVSNCFDGAVPSEICGAVNLTTLALDGMMSARNCQKRFFPSWTGIESYGLQDHVIGGVPGCLLSMRSLETLHLSGNGLTGSFSSNVSVKETLTDLSLSHNIFTGKIPRAHAEPDSVLKSSVAAAKEWMAVFAAQTGDLRSLSHIAQFGRFMRALRWSVFLMLCFIVVILLPTYSALSTAFDTYTFEYAWEVSATYLTGLTATVVLLVVFMWYGVVCFAVLRDQMPSSTTSAEERKSIREERVTWTTELYVTLTALISWNIVLVTGVNVAYVYISHDYSSNIVHITQLFVAMFKVTWNSYIVGELFRLTVDNSSSHHIILACYNYDTSQLQQTSYNPPFIYSYQCSSTFVTTYSSIYIFMFTIDAFVTPALLWLAKLIHGRTVQKEGVVSNGLDMILPRIMKVQGGGATSSAENLLPAQYFTV